MKEDVFAQVEKNIDQLVENSADWTASAAQRELQDAREGRLRLMFFDREVPVEWLGDVKGKKVLCLAGAGGLQAPLLACAGADVTVIDLSGKMLEKDREIAKRENLQIELVKGNMCDLSMFGDASFDLIINPPSFMYLPDPAAAYRESFRVLKKGGVFLMMAPNLSIICVIILRTKQAAIIKRCTECPIVPKSMTILTGSSTVIPWRPIWAGCLLSVS